MANSKKRAKRKTKARGTKRTTKNKGFLGFDFSSSGKNDPQQIALEVLKCLGAVIVGTAAGAGLGYGSLAGIPVGILAIIKKSPILASLAFTAAAAPLLKLEQQAGVPGTTAPATTTAGFDGMEGFDIRKFGADAKARLEAYFQGLTEKLTLGKMKPSVAAATLKTVQGLFGPDESVSYFLNPGSVGEVDNAILAKLKEQIAQATAGNNQVNGDNENEDDFAGII